MFRSALIDEDYGGDAALDSVAVARFVQFDQAFVQENRRSWVCSDLLDGDSRGPVPVYMLVSVISYPHIRVLVAELVLQSKKFQLSAVFYPCLDCMGFGGEI